MVYTVTHKFEMIIVVQSFAGQSCVLMGKQELCVECTELYTCISTSHPFMVT